MRKFIEGIITVGEIIFIYYNTYYSFIPWFLIKNIKFYKIKNKK